MKLTPSQQRAITRGSDWFEPVGGEWRTCDALVKRGLMEHNGASRGHGERFRKLVETPERTLDSKPAQPIAFQPNPTHSEGAENAGGGDNSTGTDGRTIIKIENSPSEANCGTSHGDQELAQNEGEESPAPERNPERKSPLPTPSETKS